MTTALETGLTGRRSYNVGAAQVTATHNIVVTGYVSRATVLPRPVLVALARYIVPTLASIRFRNTSTITRNRSRTLGGCLLVCVACLLLVTSLACTGCRGSDDVASKTGHSSGAQNDTPQLLPVRHGRKYGYVDREGRIRIQLKYEYPARRFIGKYAVVGYRGRRGLIDRHGNVIVKPSYFRLMWLDDEVYVYRSGRGWGILDVRTGRRRMLPQLTYVASRLSGRLVAVQVDGKSNRLGDPVGGRWGYMSLEGEVVIEPRFECARSFAGSVGCVKVNGKWGMIDERGRFVVEPDLDRIKPVEHSLGCTRRYYVVEREGLCGLIGRGGQWLVKPQYEGVADFGESWMAVKYQGEYCFIDSEGQVQLQMADTEVPSGVPYHGFFEDRAAIQVREGGYVWIDKQGVVQIGEKRAYLPFHFTENKVCVVWLARQKKGQGCVSALMNLDGQYVFGPARCMVSHYPLYFGMNKVWIGEGENQLETYIRSDGSLLWRPEGYCLDVVSERQ